MSAQPWPALRDALQDPAQPLTRPVVLALDMDGTLLRGDGTIPEAFWEKHRQLEQRHGIHVIPASGRQLETLRTMFGGHGSMAGFLAENGAVVEYGGQIVATQPWPVEAVAAGRTSLVTADQTLGPGSLGLVVCGVESAYTNATDETLIAQMREYYHALEPLKDLSVLDGRDDIVKIACFTGEIESHRVVEPAVDYLTREGFHEILDVVPSAAFSVDIVQRTTNKAVGLQTLADHLGVTVSQTAAVGDYLNDYELIRAAGLGIVVANAHEQLVQIADYMIPANTDEGVIALLDALLETGDTQR